MLYSLNHYPTCRFEVRQALIYQLVSGLTDENGKYNYAKAVHHYPPFFDISCSAKNYKIASALTQLWIKRNIFVGSFFLNRCYSYEDWKSFVTAPQFLRVSKDLTFYGQIEPGDV